MCEILEMAAFWNTGERPRRSGVSLLHHRGDRVFRADRKWPPRGSEGSSHASTELREAEPQLTEPMLSWEERSHKERFQNIRMATVHVHAPLQPARICRRDADGKQSVGVNEEFHFISA